MIKCQHCGRQIPYDANLCPYCGRSIKQFQQKEVLDGDIQEDTTNKEEEVIIPRPPVSGNDRKLLFFIIAVLLLLLIIGGIYHYSSTKEQVKDNTVASQVDSLAEIVARDSVKTTDVKYNPKKSQKVVVNGEGVRLRHGPSLKADYLKDEHGATKSVKKGTRLECVGEKGDWYQVVYAGKRYYMSKQYTYLEE